MPSLKEAMVSIRELVKEKGHEDTLDAVPLKLLFAIIEISEAADIWKKYSYDRKYIPLIEEELIDGIFYLLDAYGILHREFSIDVSKDPDEMFDYKLNKNFNRPYFYGRPDLNKPGEK